MLKKMRYNLGPLFLILTCPPFAMVMWYTNTVLQGSLTRLWDMLTQQGFFSAVYEICQPIFFGSPTAWLILLIFILFEFFLLKSLRGKTFYGPITPKGNIPVYKANGVAAFIITMLTFCVGSFYLHLFSASILYDNFGAILGALNILSLSVCVLLYLKGRFYPSSTDCGLTGNIIFDYYWGTELYPQILGANIKMFISCRLGMMSWGLMLISYAAKQHELFGISNALLLSIGLQFVYLTKFYMWETGYLASLDIMHDRAGFYICWGCLVWVPCVYTSPSMYLVLHPNDLSAWLVITIAVLGTASILINYFADRQRQMVRATAGKCKVWGKQPRLALANYTTEQGVQKQSLLLTSGWWGIARHFHYVPEIAAAFFWSVPALFASFIPYFYVCFLSILLLDRAFRDDKRCAKKYGRDWQAYCKLVPYKIIPLVI
jgi:7-dehydrocholesterol reductase